MTVLSEVYVRILHPNNVFTRIFRPKVGLRIKHKCVFFKILNNELLLSKVKNYLKVLRIKLQC